MKLTNKNVGMKKECIAYLYEVVNQIAGDTLTIEEQKIAVPGDVDLLYKVKYSEEPGETKLTIKLEWPNDIPVPEMEEVEEAEVVEEAEEEEKT